MKRITEKNIEKAQKETYRVLSKINLTLKEDNQELTTFQKEVIYGEIYEKLLKGEQK